MRDLDILGTPYVYNNSRLPDFKELADRVRYMRAQGRLSPEVLYRISKHFRIKNIYHSNAIEGNVLTVGETREVVEQGLTLTGKPLKDQAEARNLLHALDFLEELASSGSTPIRENDVRQLHGLVLQGIAEEAGSYRSKPVSISGSEYSPPRPEAIPAEMAALGNWLAEASVPSEDAFAGVPGLLAAAAAHTWFVTVHPFTDGNGRVARLLMNLMLMRYGYPIAVIAKEDRLRYYDALEFSQASDLTPFIVLLAECIEESLEEYEAAAEEQREQIEWAASIAAKFSKPVRTRVENEYEAWKNAMELLKSYVQQTVDIFNQEAEYGRVSFSGFGNLAFERYTALLRGESAKRTWFLRVDFRRDDATARYLFFFGHASSEMQCRCQVTLHVALEEPPKSFHYERLEYIESVNVPDLAEVGYEMSKERFVIRKRNGRPRTSGVEEFTRGFFEDVISKHFST